MARARKRKDMQFKTSITKSVFLYGRPNHDKYIRIKSMQSDFVQLVNLYMNRLSKNPDLTMQIVMNDKKHSCVNVFEKSIRPEKTNSAFSQEAMSVAITHLSNRMDCIRQDMYSENKSIFAASKTLFAMSITGRTKDEMLSVMEQIASVTKKDKDFYRKCIDTLKCMSEEGFCYEQSVFMLSYASVSMEYKIPEVRHAQMPFDSRLMRIEESTDTEFPYVIAMTDAYHKGKRIIVPVNTSRHSLNKIKSHKMAGTAMLSISDDGILQVGWSYEEKRKQPKTVRSVGVDVGISDMLHTSDDEVFGSMKPVLDFYKDIVEPSFASLSDMRNKKRNISHYLRKHKDLPEDVRRSLIQKMDLLDRMIQKADAPYHKKRHYHAILDSEIKKGVETYIDSISPDVLTVLEKLDIREFDKSRKSNGMLSVFARGKLQQRLMERLNHRGYDFKEILPDYTSQVCPVCSCLEKENRNGKAFECVCCGYSADADYVGSLNIKRRAEDKEILGLCEEHRYIHKELQKNLKMLYKSRNEQYKAATGCNHAGYQSATAIPA